MASQQEVVDVPLSYPTSTFFLDEAGVVARDCFTVAGIKVRRVGELTRAVRQLRDKFGVTEEFKFNTVNDGSRAFAFALVDALLDSDAQIVGCVVDSVASRDPFDDCEHRWVAHADILAQLIIGCTNRRELVCALLDGIGTPRGTSLEDYVRHKVNQRLGSTTLVSAVTLDSRSTDLLQLADLVASAISFERRRRNRRVGSPTSAKGLVAARLGASFGNPGLVDGRDRRFNIQTYSVTEQRRPGLSIVPRACTA